MEWERSLDHADRPDFISELVRGLAAERGISERTAWRWTARLRQGDPFPARGRACGQCGRPLPKKASRRRRYCRDSCRVRAHRQTPPALHTDTEKDLDQPDQVSLDEAAYLLSVSRWLLHELVHSNTLPLKLRRDRRGYQLPRASVQRLFDAPEALPLVRLARAHAREHRNDPRELLRLAKNGHELKQAHRQATALLRLARAGRSPAAPDWRQAERLLRAARNLLRQQQGRWPTRTHYQALSRNLERQQHSFEALAAASEKRYGPDPGLTAHRAAIAATPPAVRAYLKLIHPHRRTPSTDPTIDCDELWNQLSNHNPHGLDSATALHQIAQNLNYPENLLDAGITAARETAAWLTTIANNQQPPAR